MKSSQMDQDATEHLRALIEQLDTDAALDQVRAICESSKDKEGYFKIGGLIERKLLTPSRIINEGKEAETAALLACAKEYLHHCPDPSWRAQIATYHMHAASIFGHMDWVEMLIESGAFDLPSVEASAFLTQAIRARQNEIVERLLQVGVDPNLGDYPPWFFALSPNQAHFLPVLFEYGADIACVNKAGNSALREWIYEYRLDDHCHPLKGEWSMDDVFEFIVEKGVSFEQKDKKGRTPLKAAIHLAKERAGLPSAANALRARDMIKGAMAHREANVLSANTSVVRKSHPGVRL